MKDMMVCFYLSHTQGQLMFSVLIHLILQKYSAAHMMEQSDAVTWKNSNSPRFGSLVTADIFLILLLIEDTN